MRRILDRVEALPGVVAAGMVNRLPLAGGAQTAGIEFEGIDSGVVPAQGLQSDLRPISPDYFRAMGIPLVSGRPFTETDDDDALPVGIIDERAAKLVFRGENPLGRRFRPVIPVPRWLADDFGVAGHLRHEHLTRTDVRNLLTGRTRRIAKRWSRINRRSRRARAIDCRRNPLGRSRTADLRCAPADEVVDRSLAQRWLQTALLTAFASIALLLASIGVYGVIAYAVGQRRREFGIRLALGARRSEIVGLVMRRGALLFAVGAAIGIGAAAASARVLGGLLYNVRGVDPVSFGVATAVLLAVAMLACGLPARRAAAVDPSVTLRTE
jgi:putative ABC transport system permease protein